MAVPPSTAWGKRGCRPSLRLVQSKDSAPQQFSPKEWLDKHFSSLSVSGALFISSKCIRFHHLGTWSLKSLLPVPGDVASRSLCFGVSLKTLTRIH